MNKPIPEFKAIYNPYTRQLKVKYGNKITEHFFENAEEWTKVSYNGDDNHPNYLHIQLDYDEHLQLLFYPRVDNDQYLYEDLGSYFHDAPNEPKESDQITIVFNDEEWYKAIKKLQHENV